jgi:exopolysaccharide (amylovoran) exporter
MSKLKQQAGWTMGSSLVAALIQVALLVILARTLSTPELGVYAILQVFVGIALVFQDAGLSNFHIHRQDTNQQQISSLFIFCFLLGCLVTLCVRLLSPIIALFYETAELEPLLALLSFQFVLVSAGTLFQADLIKHFRQVRLAKIEIATRLFSFTCTLYLLITLKMGLHAVVFGMLTGSAVKLLLLWCFSAPGLHPFYKPDWRIVPQAWRYGYFQLLSQFINQIRTQADQLIIGKLLGMELLGFYSLAKELVLKPSRFITPLIQRLLMPRFARQQNSADKQQQLFLKSLQVLGWANGMVFSLIALLAWPLVLVLYGDKYSLTANILSILCIYAMFRPIGMLFASIAQANGRTDVEFKWNLLAGILMISSIGIASTTNNIVNVALTLSSIQIFLTVCAYWYFNHALQSHISIKTLKVVALPTTLTFFSAIAGIWITISLTVN